MPHPEEVRVGRRRKAIRRDRTGTAGADGNHGVRADLAGARTIDITSGNSIATARTAKG